MRHSLSPACRHLGKHESSNDHWMIIGEYQSPIDQAPIVAIANLASTNSKVSGSAGIPTAGIYIIRSDIDPRDASALMADQSICGYCPARRSADIAGHCYVTIGRGPLRAYQVIRNARAFDVNAFRDMFVRFGEYGDPAFIPLDTLESIASVARGFTGYTHTWTYRDPAYARFLMASVEHSAGAVRARALGYRTFRVRTDSALESNEFACPASAESGHRLTCSQCGACDGAYRGSSRANVSIISHGAVAGRIKINA